MAAIPARGRHGRLSPVEPPETLYVPQAGGRSAGTVDSPQIFKRYKAIGHTIHRLFKLV